MADQAETLKAITDNIEGMYQALRLAAANISGLLAGGQATCDEVRAYNLWALATYNTQRGMLTSLRAGGEENIPDLPASPTLFAWRGHQGVDAVNIDCGSQPSNLDGLMAQVLKGPKLDTKYLSTNDLSIVTQDPNVFDPDKAPSFKALLMVQQARLQQKLSGLGVIGVLIVIAAIVIGVSVAIAAIMHYLEVNEVQKANTEQTRLQAEAFANYTAARLQCMTSCASGGKSQDECADVCAKLITKPDIKLPGQNDSWGILQWIGFIVVASGITVAAWRIYKRHKSGRPWFELPDSAESAIHH